jgi:hypothetical protein
MGVFLLKKELLIVVMLATMLCLSACGVKEVEEVGENNLLVEEVDLVQEEPENVEENKPWRIMVVSRGRVDFMLTQAVAQKYETAEMYTQMYSTVTTPGISGIVYVGEKIIHVALPELFYQENEVDPRIIGNVLTQYPEVKVSIFCQGAYHVPEMTDKVREMRDDLLILCYAPWLGTVRIDSQKYVPPDCIFLDFDNDIIIGHTIPAQAAEMGAKTLVNYSYMRNEYEVGDYVKWRNIMKAECERLGIEFVDVVEETFDRYGVVNIDSPDRSQTYYWQDVSRKMAQYGKDTAFFSTAYNTQLLKICFELGAIYPSIASPYYCFPYALRLTSIAYEPDSGWLHMQDLADTKVLQAVIDEINQKIVDAGLGGRFAAVPIPYSMLFMLSAADYGVKWMDGEVPKEGIDIEALRECMEAYTGSGVDIEVYTEVELTYNNYLLITEPYLVFR